MYQLTKINHQNNLLDYYELKNSVVLCKIFPNLGASIQELTIANTEVIQGIDAEESQLPYYRRYYPSSFLFPFPGRVSQGSYEYKGTRYQLPTNEGGRDNAIHGFIAEAPFELVEHSLGDEDAFLNFQYSYEGNYEGFPFPAQLNIGYQFIGRKLHVTFKITNTGTSSFPFGLGWHPYFIAEKLETSKLKFQASKQLTADEHQIPTGAKPNEFKSTIESQVLDDGFLLDDRGVIFNATAYDLRMETFVTNHQYLQLYTPPSRRSIAIEPMTCEPNAFNSEKGLLELAAGEVFEWDIRLQFRMLYE